MDNKYKNAKIYTIRYGNDDSLIYVGSTVQPLYKRLSQHKKDSKKPENENRQLYKKINETDFNDWYIELFEDFPCERKEQLLQREGQVIREIATLNKQISGRTKQEYYEDNKEQNQEYFKEYSNHDKSTDIYISKLRYYKNNDLFEAIVKVKNWTQENEENMDNLIESIRENLWPEKNTDCPCFITVRDEILELVFDIQRLYKVTEKKNNFVTKIQEIYPFSDEEEDYYYEEEYDYHDEEDSEEDQESDEQEEEESEETEKEEESINDENSSEN